MKTFTLILVISSFCTFFVSCSDAFLPKHCKEAQDCYVIPGRLSLACSYNVNRCNCQQTFRTIHHLEFVDGQCLMSKYGPCSSQNGTDLTVDCLDGFQCIDNQCRDPAATKIIPTETPYQFDQICDGSSCEFTDKLRFTCSAFSGRNPAPSSDQGKCECNIVLPADGPSNVWDIRNYHGGYNCSVGKFGPCGDRNGMKVDCHTPGTQCINGRCMDPNHLISIEGEMCEVSNDCADGLRCSASYKCIKPSKPYCGMYCEMWKSACIACKSDDECKRKLKCR